MITKQMRPDTFDPTKNDDGTETASGYDGSVTLAMLDYMGRAKLLRDMRHIDDGFDRLIKLVEMLPAQFVSADITRKDDGRKFTTLDDLMAETDLGPTVSWMANKILEKARVSSPS